MSSNKLYRVFLGATLAALVTGCNSEGNNPGYVYFPDMTYSQAYETYAEADTTLFADGMQARLPVKNTIPRGYTPFDYENTIEEYERAGEELENPLEPTDENLQQGQYFYSIYCAVCHGSSGEGQGTIVQGPAGYPPPPSYFNQYMLDLPDGQMFFSIHYGRNLMGSYATQLTQKERWQVITYINKLQSDKQSADSGDAGSAAQDTVQSAGTGTSENQ